MIHFHFIALGFSCFLCKLLVVCIDGKYLSGYASVHLIDGTGGIVSGCPSVQRCAYVLRIRARMRNGVRPRA